MSRRELDVGSFVHLPSLDGISETDECRYRIEQLVKTIDGPTLYKVRNEAEPFDRLVGERDLTRRT
jgi:hypothetical protein